MSELKPIAYAIYGIGGGKHYLKDVKPIQADDVTEEWRGDDDFLGDYWAGNEPLFLASTQPEATKPAMPVVIQAFMEGNERESGYWFDISATSEQMHRDEGYKIRRLYDHALAQDLSAAVMNIRCEVPPALSKGEAYQYKLGHRDARHAAAELANEAALASPADALVAGDSETAKDAERYRFLRDHGVPETDAEIEKALTVYQGVGLSSLLPDELDSAIDAAIQAQKDGHG